MENNGSVVIYRRIIKPFVKKHETTIDSALKSGQKLAGEVASKGVCVCVCVRTRACVSGFMCVAYSDSYSAFGSSIIRTLELQLLPPSLYIISLWFPSSYLQGKGDGGEHRPTGCSHQGQRPHATG